MLISGHYSAAWVSVAGGWWLGLNTCPSPNLVITPWLTACSGVVAALAYLTRITHYKKSINAFANLCLFIVFLSSLLVPPACA